MQLIWLEYLNAFRNITRQYRRSLFGILAVTFGVVALVLTAGFIEWIFWATREGTIQAGLGHIHVLKRDHRKNAPDESGDNLILNAQEDRAAIAQFPNVQLVAPRLAFNGLISHEGATISFIGEGVNPKAERVLSRTLAIVHGENLSSEHPRGILLGRGLAENLGVKVGQSVVLLTTLATGGVNAVECTVRGLFNTVSKAYDDSALRVPLPVAQELLRVSGVDRWIIVLNDTEHTGRTTSALREKLGSRFEFVPWYQLADFYNKVVELLSRQIGVVKVIIAIIIILSISNTMMMNVLQRTSEIGTSMALGCSRRHVRRQFMYEGLTIGWVGGMLGVLLGWLLAALISHVGIPMPPPPGMSQGYSGEILLTPQLLLHAFAIAIGTTVVASFYPAWKASRMEIVDALRHMR